MHTNLNYFPLSLSHSPTPPFQERLHSFIGNTILNSFHRLSGPRGRRRQVLRWGVSERQTAARLPGFEELPGDVQVSSLPIRCCCQSRRTHAVPFPRQKARSAAVCRLASNRWSTPNRRRICTQNVCREPEITLFRFTLLAIETYSNGRTSK